MRLITLIALTNFASASRTNGAVNVAENPPRLGCGFIGFYVRRAREAALAAAAEAAAAAAIAEATTHAPLTERVTSSSMSGETQAVTKVEKK